MTSRGWSANDAAWLATRDVPPRRYREALERWGDDHSWSLDDDEQTQWIDRLLIRELRRRQLEPLAAQDDFEEIAGWAADLLSRPAAVDQAHGLTEDDGWRPAPAHAGLELPAPSGLPIWDGHRSAEFDATLAAVLAGSETSDDHRAV